MENNEHETTWLKFYDRMKVEQFFFEWQIIVV